MSSVDTNAIFSNPIKMGKYELKNRIVMAPLTRIRSNADLEPTDLHVQYYSSRATPGGYLISEATVLCPQSIASNYIPAIFNENQAKAWKKVVDAVHAKGGLFSCQLWHQGRVAHDSFTKHPLAIAANATVCESASDVKYDGKSVTFDGKVEDYNAPKAMTIEDIERFKEQYMLAAHYALDVAGFDTIELHAAHGYLLAQFFEDGTNKRTDQYGGSLENRFRLVKELLTALIEKYPGRVGIRISPHNNVNSFFGVTSTEPVETYTYILTELAQFDLAHLQITEPRWVRTFTDSIANDPGFSLALTSAKLLENFRSRNKTTPVLGAGGFTPISAMETLTSEDSPYDAICFGRFYISNPDITFRIINNLPLNEYNRQTFYTTPPFPQDSFPVGYIDYPTFEEVVKSKYGEEAKVEDFIGNTEKINELIELTKNDKYPLISIETLGTATSKADRK